MPFAVAAASMIAALASLHVYWGAGGRWPGRDAEDLASRVVGTTSFPPPAACFAVAVGLAAASSVVVIASADLGWPLARHGAWAVAIVFAVRGAGGFFDGVLRPAIREHPYYRANLLYYSPLCLTIAALVLAARLTA